MMINENGLRFICKPRLRTSTTLVDVREVPFGFTRDILSRLHLARGWLGVGYHYFISKDGMVDKLRDDECCGVDCSPSAICICIEGTINILQRNQIRGILLRIDKKYPSFREVRISKTIEKKIQ